MSPVTRTLARLLACWLLLTTVGCATLNLSNMDLRSRKATARNPALRVICLWEPAEGRDPKGVPCQGFAGQILFLTNTSLPVSVDGDIRVYQFDDQGTPAEQAKPLHQFDFDSGAWAKHYSYGTLGPAYNVFIPYMRRGAYDATCALRVRLTPKHGPVVFSEMTSIDLLGFDQGKHPIKASLTDSRVEQTLPEDLTAVNKRRRTTTIVLNSQNGVASDSAESLPGHAGSDQIQQAAFATEAAVRPLTANDSREAQLEQMVNELKAQQAVHVTPARKPSSPTPSAQQPTTPPRRLDDDDDSPRIKVRAAAAEQQPADKLLEPDQQTSASDRSRVRKVSGMTNEHSRPHPLEDGAEPDILKPSVRVASHPLSIRDDGPFGSTTTASAAMSRSATFRHPLEESPNDPPSRESATRKTIPATESAPPVEPARGGSFDPFDPIDTEAIETTAVQETPTIRRRLRTANQ